MDPLLLSIGRISATTVVAVISSVLISLGIQHVYLKKTRKLYVEWEQQKSSEQQNWEIEQEVHFSQLEARLMSTISRIRETWRMWQEKDDRGVEACIQQYEKDLLQADKGRALRLIPRTDEMPMV